MIRIKNKNKKKYMKYIRLWTDEIFSQYIILQKVYIKIKKPKTKIKIKKNKKITLMKIRIQNTWNKGEFDLTIF